jgi:hypothetical protein
VTAAIRPACKRLRRFFRFRGGPNVRSADFSGFGINVDNRDLNPDTAGLFELRLTCLENEATWNAIGQLAEKVGGDRSAMFFGAPAPERL